MLDLLKYTFKYGWRIIILVAIMFEIILIVNGGFFDLIIQKIGLLGILLTIITVGYSLKQYEKGNN